MIQHFALLLALIAPAVHADAVAATPHIEVVGGETVDLGSGRPGRFARQLAITNTGTDTLRLLALSSGCGCLIGEPDRSALGPGDTAHIQVTIETSGQIVERWSRVLTIATNDPLRRSVDVVFRIAFEHDIRLSTLVNTVHRERCDGGCVWHIELENIGRGPLVVDPPFVEEMRGVTVAFDLAAPATLAPGEKLSISGRIVLLGGEEIPSARVLLNTSGPLDPSTSLGWFYLPDAR